MNDVIFVALVIAFFTVCVAYVRGCARIIGDDEVVRVTTGGDADEVLEDAA